MREAKISGPLPCYGLWAASSPCKECEHATPCSKISPLAKLKSCLDVNFDFVPEGIRDLGRPADDVQADYALCHFTVYGQEPHDHIGRVENAKERLAEISEELGCSKSLFMLAVMTAAHVSNPDRAFFANMLFGPSAVTRFESYREQCRIRFGQFDFQALELAKPSHIRGKFLASEIIFGEFVVDSIIYCEGAVPFERLFLIREIAFDPFWLAVEESYVDSVLKPHLEGKIEKTREANKVRSLALQSRRSLLKNKSRARTVFSLRASIMKEATEAVLRKYRLGSSDLLFKSPVTEPLTYWVSLGLAVRRLVLLRTLDDIS